jgi:hypothetical protein
MLMVTLHTKKLNDHGVSEAIGFMLIFSIVIAGIGLVTLYGYPLLLQQQVSADEKIMEKNMIVLQNDIKSLAYKTVPFKETSLKIGGGSLTVFNSSYSPSSSSINISDSTTTYVNLFTPGELRYESVSSQTDISLQNGAVVMRPRISPGSVMLSEPRWFYDDQTNTMVINLINITSSRFMAKEGIGAVQMTLGQTNYTNVPIPAGTTLTLDYTPDVTGVQNYSVAWGNYFTNSLSMTLAPIQPFASPTKRYQLPTDTTRPATLVIKKYEVQIKNI